MKLTTGMLYSDEWDKWTLNLLLHNINVFRVHLWENKEIITLNEYINSFFRDTLIWETHQNIIDIGEGENIAVFYVDDTSDFSNRQI